MTARTSSVRVLSTTTARFRRGWVAAAALGLGGAVPPVAKAPAFQRLAPERLTLAGGEVLKEPVFLQADRQGALRLVSGAGRLFLPLQPAGKLGEPARYDPAGLPGGMPLRAAMGRDGDWVVFSPPEIRLYRDGKEKVLPKVDWSPIDVGFLRGDPVVNTDVLRITPGPRNPRREDPPLLLRWNGKEWETFVREPVPPKMELLDPQVRLLRTAHLLGDSRGRLWLANEYLYRIRCYSSSGKLLAELTRGPQQLEDRADAAQARAKLEAATATWKKREGAALKVNTVTSRRVFEALAEGRDGKLYFLAHEPAEGGDYALDRYDPATLKVERILLNLREPAFLTMASGRDALYLATVVPGRGPWRIAWADLDQARWRRLRDVQIDRQAADETPVEAPRHPGH